MTDLQQIAISLAVFAALLTGMLNFSGGVFNQYDSNIVNSTKYGAVENTSEDLDSKRQAYTSSSKSQSQDVDKDIEQDTFFISSIAEGVTNIYTAGAGLITAVSTLDSELGLIPKFLPTLIIALLTIAMVWGIFKFTFS